MATSDSDIEVENNQKKVLLNADDFTPDKIAQIAVSVDGDTILHALANNDEDIVYGGILFKAELREFILCKMLSAGMDINIKNSLGYTPLHKAVSIQSFAYIKILLENGADIESEDDTECLRPLHIACEGFDIESGNKTLGEGGYLDIIQMLLDRGAQIDCRSNILVTPCMFAAANGFTKCLNLMLQNGANVNAQDHKGYSVIHHAEYYFDCADLLLKYGADINIQNKHGQTPLHVACNHAQYDGVAFFCERGASLEIRNDSGETPLHCACVKHFTRKDSDEQSLKKCCIILCDYGADINSVCFSNFGISSTPLSCSAFCGFKEICRLFLDRGVKLPPISSLKRIEKSYEETSYQPLFMPEADRPAADCRPMIALEYELRIRRKAFDFGINHFIEYPFYKQKIYELCFPHGLGVTIPAVGFIQAEAIRDKYYYDEIFFLLNLWIAQQSTKMSSSLSASKYKEHFASSCNKTATLMSVLSSHLKEFLRPNIMFCATCNSVGTLKCSKCKIYHYCSHTCQKMHWATHKLSCYSHEELVDPSLRVLK